VSDTLLNVLLIFVFIVIGGVFAAAEMALVSLRDSQIRSLSHRGGRGRTIAKLTSDPNRFLSAVQVGVTLSGFLSAAFGGATLAEDLSPVLQRTGLNQTVSDALALVAITAVIAYASIVLGELTAKRLALQRSEGFALALAPLVDLIATLARPVIWLLGVSTNVAVRVLGGDPRAGREQVSDEEIRAMVSGSSTLGVEERRIVDEVFAAGERGLREVMVPRTEVDFLPGRMQVREAVRMLQTSPHSRYPVTGESADDVLGFVHVRDLLVPGVASSSVPVRNLVRPVISLPESVRVLRALTDMRAGSSHLAIVLDEYGGTAGIVTLEDLVEELVGDINDEYDIVEPEQAVGSPDLVEVDGLLTLDEFTERTGQELPPGHYNTVAGFVMAQLGEVPTLAAEFALPLPGDDELDPDRDDVVMHPWRFTVIELDGRRAARIRAERLHGPAEHEQTEAVPTPAPAAPTDPDPGHPANPADRLAPAAGGTDQLAGQLVQPHPARPEGQHGLRRSAGSL